MAKVLAVLTLLLLAVAPAAGAAVIAPEYTSSDPADGDELHQAPENVTITFSEPVQESGSSITVTDHCGNRLDDKNVQVSLNEMSVGLAKTPSGHYKVEYVATGLAGATGSSEGSFGFTVHAGTPCAGGSGTSHGGHGGHGNHGGMNGSGNAGGHSGHPGGQQHGSSGHSNHSTGNGEGHSTHSTSGGEHGTTHATDEHGHGEEGHGGHHDKNVAAGNGSGSVEDRPQLASGETPLPRVNPDSVAVLLALLLCAGFGMLGGWVLRVSAPK